MLTVVSRKKAVWIVTSYLGEGLPWSVMHQMVTEYLTSIHASLEQIGSTSLLHIGTTLKPVWSPIVDVYGSKRAWMIAMQGALGVAMATLAAFAGGDSLRIVWVILAGMSVLSAAHDIACDGAYMLGLDARERAFHSGTRQAAFRAAMILGGSGLVWLAGYAGSWRLAFGLAGGIMATLALVNAFVLPHASPPPRRSGAPALSAPGGPATRAFEGPTLATSFFESYRSFLTQPQAVRVLLFMLLYKIGDVMMFAMSKPLLRDLGVSTAQRGIINGVGTGVFVFGSFVGGIVIARRGLDRTLIPLTYFQNLCIPLYAGMALLRPPLEGIVAVVVIEQFASAVGTAANMVFLMQRCRGTFSASHYAFATALVGLMSTFSGTASGWIDARVGHAWFFMIAFACSLPAMALALVVPRGPLEPAPASAGG